MRLLLAISTQTLFNAYKVAEKYFLQDALDRAFRQNTLSRETVIYMSPDQFLRLARPGFEQDKLDGVNEVLDSGKRLNEIPFLGVVTRDDGDVEVASEGRDHEGRHRMWAMKERKARLVPVRIISREHEGPAFRLGNTTRRPKWLYGFGTKMEFPDIETYPTKT
jgi:hypothetical protein